MRKLYTPTALVAALALGGWACQSAPRPDAARQNAAPANAAAENGNVASAAAPQQPAAPVTHLKAGDPAPDFALTDTEGQTVRLSDFRGKKNVVLAFYVLAFTGG